MASALEICRICLRGNVKMFTFNNTNIKDLYQLLMQVYVDNDDGKPATVCFLCHARLQQCDRLQKQAIKSNELLEQLLRGGFMATANAITNSQYTSQDLQVSTMYHLDLEPTTWVDVLLEPNVESDSLVSVKEETETIAEERKNVFLKLDFSQDGYDPCGFFPEAIHSDSKEDKQITEVGSNHCNGVKDVGHGLEQRKHQDEDFSEDGYDPNDFAPKPIYSDSEDDQPLILISSNKCVGIKDTIHGLEQSKDQEKEKVCEVQSEKEVKNSPVPSSSIVENIMETRINFKRWLKNSKTDVVPKKPKLQSIISNKDMQKKNMLGTKTTHVKTISEEFICSYCSEQFCTKEILTDHIPKCTKTTETLVNDNELTKTDMLISSLPEMYSCNICTYKTYHKRSKELHLKMHTVSKVFSCNICDCRFAQKSHLKRHTRTHTGEKPFSCNICEHSFSENSHLKRHMKKHSGERPFSCTICGYTCALKNNLKQHIRTHTSEKPFSCNICEYKFAEKSHLKRHMRTHTGEKPFSCNICGYKCALKDYLKQHIRTHTGEKPFSCNICEYKCAQKNNLKDHMRTHTGEKPFSCNICDYKCVQKFNLKQHIRTHTGEKPFSCNICEYRSARNSYLKTHMRTHTSE